MVEHLDERFSYLYDARPEKPRDTGMTFVVGDARNIMGTNAMADLMAFGGAWIDWYKFVHSALPFQPPELVGEKLALLEENDVQAFPGGNFLEIAVDEGVERRFLESVREVGCHRIEVSRTAVDIGVEEKAELIRRAADMGFAVHGEVGRKPSEGSDHMTTGQVIDEMRSDLEAGADKVVYETEAVVEELLTGGGPGERETEALDTFRDVTDAVGRDNVVFELPLPLASNLPQTTASAWFIDNFGPDVNLGNVIPHWINLLEQQRRGIGPKTYEYTR